ncbi:MAG: hypothetical protein MJ247_04850 [Alphaproteobacteria bacterium]|nr:hypothetical protein [Alphaproteobacteria bacterium]
MKILYIALAILLASTVDASAEVFDSVVGKTAKVFASVRTVTFVIGGFGLVGVAAGAIFGQVKWRWVAALAIGLAILAVAGGVVDYVTGTSTGSGNYADTLK